MKHEERHASVQYPINQEVMLSKFFQQWRKSECCVSFWQITEERLLTVIPSLPSWWEVHNASIPSHAFVQPVVLVTSTLNSKHLMVATKHFFKWPNNYNVLSVVYAPLGQNSTSTYCRKQVLETSNHFPGYMTDVAMIIVAEHEFNPLEQHYNYHKKLSCGKKGHRI